MKISKQELWNFFADTGDESAKTRKYMAIHKNQFRVVCADFSMSENHIGGDDVIKIVNDTIKAINEKLKVVTWYGPELEVLIIGIDPELYEKDFADWPILFVA
jgi:hypothetical protein